jgi:tetratricopeptide (TPR) repeat protein
LSEQTKDGLPGLPTSEAPAALFLAEFAMQDTLSLAFEEEAGNGVEAGNERTPLIFQPSQAIYLNTLGVAEYRVGRNVEAIETLNRSLAAGSTSAGFDLYFLAMAHHQLGHREEARGLYDQAVRWMGGQKTLSVSEKDEPAASRAEAQSVLAGRAEDIPENFFANPRYQAEPGGREGNWLAKSGTRVQFPAHQLYIH